MSKAHPLLYYIRHGQTDWNRDRRIQGQTDIPLNETGHEQARAIAARITQIVTDPADFEFIVSPLSRARQTMAHVLESYGLDEDTARVEPRLREVSFGEFDGKTWEQLNKYGIDPLADPGKYYKWRPTGGESYADTAKRVSSWLADQQTPAIVVAHGGISRILRGLVLGQTGAEFVGLPVPQDRFFKLENGEIEWIRAL